MVTKIGERILYLTGNMEIVILEYRTSEVRDIKHKGSTEGAARFSACAVGG